MTSVYNTKLPKIKRFINIYQSNTNKNSRKNIQKIKNTEKLSEQDLLRNENDNIRVIDAHEGLETEEQSLDSSLDVLAVSDDVNNQSHLEPMRSEMNLLDSQPTQDLPKNRNNSHKATDRVFTITPECAGNTSLPNINTSVTARNGRNMMATSKKTSK